MPSRNTKSTIKMVVATSKKRGYAGQELKQTEVELSSRIKNNHP